MGRLFRLIRPISPCPYFSKKYNMWAVDMSDHLGAPFTDYFKEKQEAEDSIKRLIESLQDKPKKPKEPKPVQLGYDYGRVREMACVVAIMALIIVILISKFG